MQYWCPPHVVQLWNPLLIKRERSCTAHAVYNTIQILLNIDNLIREWDEGIGTVQQTLYNRSFTCLPRAVYQPCTIYYHNSE